MAQPDKRLQAGLFCVGSCMTDTEHNGPYEEERERERFLP